MTSLQIYTDGGSRGNPGPAASAFVVLGGDKVIFHEGFYLGIATNNVAEYTAVLKALEWCSMSNDQCPIEFYLDSLLVVQQLKGKYKIKDEKLRLIHKEIQSLISNIQFLISWNHVPREQNQKADALVNQTLDREYENE